MVLVQPGLVLHQEERDVRGSRHNALLDADAARRWPCTVRGQQRPRRGASGQCTHTANASNARCMTVHEQWHLCLNHNQSTETPRGSHSAGYSLLLSPAPLQAAGRLPHVCSTIWLWLADMCLSHAPTTDAERRSPQHFTCFHVARPNLRVFLTLLLQEHRQPAYGPNECPQPIIAGIV